MAGTLRFLSFAVPFLLSFVASATATASNLSLTDSLETATEQRIVAADSLSRSVMPALGAPEITMSRHISHPKKPGVYYPQEADTVDTNRNWFHLLKKYRLNINDSTVQWPKFLKFCVDVYHWGDRTFNSFDTTYVVGTGKRWKARLVNDNWTDSYAMRFNKDMYMLMQSNIYCHLGAYVQYMAVSVGYNIDLTNILGNKPANHKKVDFGFTCARFNASFTYSENNGGTYLRRFGDYNDGEDFRLQFDGLKLKSITFNVYYMLNNRRYAESAAYGFGRIQKKSAGSFIAGFNYANQDLTLDFRKLPEELVPFLTLSVGKYRFHYNTYSFLLGYGHNWVLSRHLLLNLTALPSIGWNRCYEDSSEGKVRQFTFGINGKGSLTYNLGDFYAGITGRLDMHWYNSGNYSIISSIEDFAAIVGIRF